MKRLELAAMALGLVLVGIALWSLVIGYWLNAIYSLLMGLGTLVYWSSATTYRRNLEEDLDIIHELTINLKDCMTSHKALAERVIDGVRSKDWTELQATVIEWEERFE